MFVIATIYTYLLLNHQYSTGMDRWPVWWLESKTFWSINCFPQRQIQKYCTSPNRTYRSLAWINRSLKYLSGALLNSNFIYCAHIGLCVLFIIYTSHEEFSYIQPTIEKLKDLRYHDCLKQQVTGNVNDLIKQKYR